MKKSYLLSFLFLFFLLPLTGMCTILHVPATFGTIQAGIDASSNGDTVLLDPGTYFEHINLGGKNIVLCSWFLTTGDAAYISTTIIDGSNTGRPVTIDQGEDSTCLVSGITIQHGNSVFETGLNYGGGLLILDSSPRVLNCIIQYNTAPAYGGGFSIYGSGAAAQVRNCTVQNNSAESFGGGIFMGDCSTDAAIINCIITGNTITCSCNWNGGGGGVNLYHTGKLVNCLVFNNSAPNAYAGGGGIHCDWGDFYGSQGIFVTGCTIASNTALAFGGVSYVITGGEFRNCIIWGNTDGYGDTANYDGNSYTNCCTDPLPSGAGNISADPNFSSMASNNYRLQTGSPCINAGNNAYNNQVHDLDGNPRVVGTIDIGAYEKYSGTPVTVQIGSGTDISEHYPVYTWYGYTYSQQIYLGSEITSGGGSAGSISKIRFFYAGGTSSFSNSNNWTVYLGNTTKTDFSNNSDWVPASSMTQVFSGIIPDPVNGTWVEITLPSPFNYSGNNIVVGVDENSPNWDDSAQWGAFNAVTFRGLVCYDDTYNPDPASPPSANQGPDDYIAQVQFVITNGFGALEGIVTEEPGCTDPIQGATVTTGTYSATTNAAGFYSLMLPIGTYFDVTAHNGDVSQTISPVLITEGNTTTQDFCMPSYFAPPVSLKASLSGPLQNDVHLSWMSPGSVPDQWIRWADASNFGGLGFNGPATFTVALRWPVADIAPYGGTYLKKIRFVITEPSATYTVKVWKGADASTLLLSQVVVNPYINSWNEVTLTTPVLIDGTDEFWFGYEIVQTTGYPAGLSPGPAVVGKGDMVNAGYGWFSMKTVWNFDFNWTLQGFISESAALAPHQMVPMVENTSAQPVLNTPVPPSLKPGFVLSDPTDSPETTQAASTDAGQPGAVAPSPVPSAAVLTGYNVFRDNVELTHNTSNLNFDDPARPKGGYDYEVSAQYEFGESLRIGVHVDVYTCFPPTALTVSASTLSTSTADLSWTPSAISTNPEWTLEWGPAGFTQGNGTTALISTTPAYALTGLTPGTEYDFYVKTRCSSTDESAWVKKTFRTHYIICPSGAVAEAEPCGMNTNGCDLIPPAFETINCGETKCGTAWLSRSYRDSDWYAFTLSQPSDVTLTGNADFTSFMAIGTAQCPSTLYYASATNGAGYSTSMTTLLGAAGPYYVYVAPAYSEQVACDSLNHYWIKLTCNSCLTPTALDAVNITNTSANLSWTSNASLWNIEWGPFGFIKGTGTVISGTGSNPYLLSGLTSGVAYSYYVQSDCGGGSTSNWAGPFTFFTRCPATSLPYAEDFTSQTTGITPQCWQVSGPGSPANWVVDYYSDAGGTSPEVVFNPWAPWFSGRSFLISPVINTTGQASLELSYKQFISANNAGSTCEIWTTSNGGQTWASVWSFAQNGNIGPETNILSVNTADVGSATFQFAFAVNGNSWDLNTWHIDDISITGIPQTGTLEGIVTACSNAGLLEGVTVSAGTNTTTTNASGFYQLAGIPVGTYDAEFSLTGYVTKTVPGILVQNGVTTTLSTCLDHTGPPPVTTIQNITIASGQTVCYNATQTITVAGAGTTFFVESGGSATMIAGIKINYLPGTWAKPGSYMHGTIAPAGPYCITPLMLLTSATGQREKYPQTTHSQDLRVYPNPTNGNFRMEFTGKENTALIRVEIYGMRGEKVLSETITGERIHEFSLSDQPAGIYFIKATDGEQVLTSKLVKTR